MSFVNNVNNISILELENQFNNDLSSSLFVVLAQKYFDHRDYQRAAAVCEIGLISHPSSVVGKLILAKTNLCMNKLVDAEKLLLDILSFNPNAINPLKMLVEVQLQLRRDDKKIEKYINKLIVLLPNSEYYSTLISKKEQVKKVKKVKNYNNLRDFLYHIDDSMATFAFYNIVKSQKNYQFAFNILLGIERRSGKSPKINEEKRVLAPLLEKIN